MFLSGKGDGIIRFMEYSGGTLHHGSNDYMSNVPGKVNNINIIYRVILFCQNIVLTQILKKLQEY